MKALLLINMGSPQSRSQMWTFLIRMFTDKAILPFPKLPRYLLAFLISSLRFVASWKKYQLIGGSQLMIAMDKITADLQAELNNDMLVVSAYSYSSPSIAQVIKRLDSKGISDISVICMYPHSAFSTTGSVNTVLAKQQKNYPHLKIKNLGTYGSETLFVNYWVQLIQERMQELAIPKPFLLFSAHSIPQSNQDAGDNYAQEVEASAALIASKLGLDYRVSYQSKIGKIKWLEPDTKACLKSLKAEGMDNVLLVPISFLTENLETAYDQALDIIPYAKNSLHFQQIERVHIPHSHPTLIAAFFNLLETR